LSLCESSRGSEIPNLQKKLWNESFSLFAAKLDRASIALDEAEKTVLLETNGVPPLSWTPER
jgi:hypothetical protein